ncbi:DUF4422 domain-containing protein [Nocardioides yefusunii]|uniref:DUF4422 domain-containing protein n=1 Tax=Nocardioides yefusunii TaxID=2500546 RepID=A0ABW1QWL6_9ACTN|nr:DUF4422 domain-containing protein [Nocardioides yefusunii]
MVIATHAPAVFAEDRMYLPVHAGRALASPVAGTYGDHEGHSISERNAHWCELTALYWVWCNRENPSGLGLSHYRRYFRGEAQGPKGTRVLSGIEAAGLLADFDVVLPRRRYYVVETVRSHYAHAHVESDLSVVEQVLEECSPHLLPAWNRVMQRRSLSLYNMFLARPEHAEAYCAWLFEVLEKVESHIDLDGRNAYQARALGFLGERLLNVWIEGHPELRVLRRRVVQVGGEPVLRKAVAMLRRRWG